MDQSPPEDRRSLAESSHSRVEEPSHLVDAGHLRSSQDSPRPIHDSPISQHAPVPITDDTSPPPALSPPDTVRQPSRGYTQPYRASTQTYDDDTPMPRPSPDHVPVEVPPSSPRQQSQVYLHPTRDPTRMYSGSSQTYQESPQLSYDSHQPSREATTTSASPPTRYASTSVRKPAPTHHHQSESPITRFSQHVPHAHHDGSDPEHQVESEQDAKPEVISPLRQASAPRPKLPPARHSKPAAPLPPGAVPPRRPSLPGSPRSTRGPSTIQFQDPEGRGSEIRSAILHSPVLDEELQPQLPSLAQGAEWAVGHLDGYFDRQHSKRVARSIQGPAESTGVMSPVGEGRYPSHTERRQSLNGLGPGSAVGSINTGTTAGPRNIQGRLAPTLETAKTQRDLALSRARSRGLSLNIAIGVQVLLGALTTGLSAVAVNRKMSTAVSVLGGISTVISTYLAKARGDNEPEKSEALTKQLDQFIRELETFSMDRGHLIPTKDGEKSSETEEEWENKIQWYRQRLEDLLTGEERHKAPV